MSNPITPLTQGQKYAAYTTTGVSICGAFAYANKGKSPTWSKIALLVGAATACSGYFLAFKKWNVPSAKPKPSSNSYSFSNQPPKITFFFPRR